MTMENSGTNNNLYIPYGADNFVKRSLLSSTAHHQTIVDEKCPINQLQANNALRYFPYLSAGNYQVPFPKKESQPSPIDPNYQANCASRIVNGAQAHKPVMYSSVAGLPGTGNALNLYSQYSHNYHEAKYHGGSAVVDPNHNMLLMNQTSVSMPENLKNYYRQVQLPQREVQKVSRQKNWEQSHSHSNGISSKETPVVTPSQHVTSTKEQAVSPIPAMSVEGAAAYAYNSINGSWQPTYKSDLGRSHLVSQYMSATKALPVSVNQNKPKVSAPSTNSLMPRSELKAMFNPHSSSAVMEHCNTVHASLTQNNSSGNMVFTPVTKSKVTVSSISNHHNSARDLVQAKGQVLVTDYKKSSTAKKIKPCPVSCRAKSTSRKRSSSCDSATSRRHASVCGRRHSFSGNISTTPRRMSPVLKRGGKSHGPEERHRKSAGTIVNSDKIVSKTPAQTKRDSSVPVSLQKAMMPTVGHDSNQISSNVMCTKPDVSNQSKSALAQELGDKVKTECPSCSCHTVDNGDAPYYTHLGAARDVAGIRQLFEKRMGYAGKAIRIEKVIYTGKEARTSRGCPMAKTIIRRSGPDEKVLVVCRRRPGHHCPTATIVVVILIWDGVARPLADFAYYNIAKFVPKHGEPTERRCGTNEERTCACQGFDESTSGASFSFGCSWSMYYNGCKYARSHNPNKYKLLGTKDPEAEKFVGKICETLATAMSPLYEMAAPDAFNNQVEREEEGYECRLGEEKKKKSRPFSGVTSCLDFCAHSHKDQHNMDNGSTVVLTFTKPELRNMGGKNADEQLHVLPLCKLDLTDENGTFEGICEKVSSGSIEILDRYHHEVRLRSTPKLSKKQKSRAKKKESNAADSPSYKRKGRPPKRSTSYENLSHNNKCFKAQNSSDNCHKPQYSQEYHMSSPVQLHSPLPPGVSVQRAIPEQHKYMSGTIQSPHPGPSVPNQHGAADGGSLNDNLPSIKGFFVGPDPNFHPQNFPNCVNLQANPDLQLQNTPPHMPTAKNMVASPLVSTMPQSGSDSPNQPKHFPGMMHGSVTGDSEGYSTPSTPHSAFGDPAYPFSYGGTPPNSSHGISIPEETIHYSDCEENFLDSEIGGVAVAPGHGSVLIECAKKELHATTAVRSPNRFYPSRISLVFYQHKSMNCRNHGAAEYEAKEEERRKQKEKKMENSQALVDSSIHNAAVMQSGIPPPFNVMNSVVRPQIGTAISACHSQMNETSEERNHAMYRNLPNHGNAKQHMNPMGWMPPMHYSASGGYPSHSTYLNRPGSLPLPNSPHYTNQTSPSVRGPVCIDERHINIQSMPGTSMSQVNPPMTHMHSVGRGQVPFQTSAHGLTSSFLPPYPTSIRLPATARDAHSQMLMQHTGAQQNM